MKRLPGLVMAIALTSCASVPEPRIITKEVKIPISAPCVDSTAIPSEPQEVTLPLTDARQAADIAASQALKYHSWGRELYALIVPACTR